MKNQKTVIRTVLVFAGMLGLLSTAALAAPVTYTIAGTLSLVQGDPDPLSLNGQGFSLTVTLDSTTVPSPLTSDSTQSKGTFVTTNPVVATVIDHQTNQALLTATCGGGSAPSATIVLTDNYSSSDAIDISNCTLLTLYNMVANIQLPAGTLISVTPGAFAQVAITGQATFTPSTGGAATRLNVTNATAVATGPAQVGVPTIAGITDAAGFKTDAFAPGSIISIFGTALGPDPYVVFSLNGSGGLDSTLGNVTVTVDGVPAIPLFVYATQINAIMPFSTKTSGQASVEVEYNGVKSAEFNIPMAPAAFKLFTTDQSGKGAGAILNQDYSVNTATNPADKGSVVQLFGQGGGVLTPAVAEGQVASSTVLSNIVAPYSATVNGVASTVWYAGTAPGLVIGVDQVNVQLPADVATGSANIVVKVGDSQSQSDVTVFVK